MRGGTFHTPSLWTALAATAPDRVQHPVNTVHLGYLLFERCDKQRRTFTVNTWAHDWFKLHDRWVCPENSGRVEQKCFLTENKPLAVTGGAAAAGQGLGQSHKQVKAEGGGAGGKTIKGQQWAGLETEVRDQIIQGKINVRIGWLQESSRFLAICQKLYKSNRIPEQVTLTNVDSVETERHRVHLKCENKRVQRTERLTNVTTWI